MGEWKMIHWNWAQRRMMYLLLKLNSPWWSTSSIYTDCQHIICSTSLFPRWFWRFCRHSPSMFRLTLAKSYPCVSRYYYRSQFFSLTFLIILQTYPKTSLSWVRYAQLEFIEFCLCDEDLAGCCFTVINAIICFAFFITSCSKMIITTSHIPTEYVLGVISYQW